MEEIRTKVLVTITDKGKNKRIVNLYKRHNIKCSVELNGKGTASGSMLNYFGLEEIQKKIILSIIPYNLEGKILEDLHKKLKIYEPGKGIAFTLNINSASRYLSMIYSKERGDDTVMKKDKEYELICTKSCVTIVLLYAGHQKGWYIPWRLTMRASVFGSSMLETRKT